MANTRLSMIISGKVQGVSFRASTVEVASRLALTGYARNLNDGRVQVIAEGSQGALLELEQWCREGPPVAEVESVAAERSDASGEFRNFRIR